MLTLDAVPRQQQVRLVGFTQPMGAFRQKFLAMGLTPGVFLTVASRRAFGRSFTSVGARIYAQLTQSRLPAISG